MFRVVQLVKDIKGGKGYMALKCVIWHVLIDKNLVMKVLAVLNLRIINVDGKQKSE